MSRRRQGSEALRRTQRELYLAQRTVGDVNAALGGRLGKRLLRRVYHRRVVGLLRRGRIW